MFTLQIIGGGITIVLLLAIIGLLDKLNKQIKEIISAMDENSDVLNTTMTLFNNNFVQYQRDVSEKGIKIDNSNLYD